MRIHLTATRIAAIGELYKKGNDGIAIYELLSNVEKRHALQRKIERIKFELLDVGDAIANQTTSMGASMRDIEALELP